MTGWRNHKIRDDETWEAVRRAWEGGETAASCARRFDVGMANLWRRRAAEGWDRNRPEDPSPEPIGGWERHAQKAWDAFDRRLGEERDLAKALAAGMTGKRPEDVPMWHLPFVLAWRAEHLGAEVAAGDRARNRDQDWAGAVWDAEGRMRPLSTATLAMARANRATWRAEQGLPDGAAETWP